MFFILAGLEWVMVPVNYAQLHYLRFSFPYSHSLVAVVAWSLLAFGLGYSAWRDDRRAKLKFAFIIAGAVFLHWICDWLEHPGQLPLAGNDSYLFGLGLWDRLEIALTIEVVLAIIGTLLYLSAAKDISRTARWVIVIFMISLSSFAVFGQRMVTQAPAPHALAISMISQTLIICGLAAWVDKVRIKTWAE